MIGPRRRTAFKRKFFSCRETGSRKEVQESSWSLYLPLRNVRPSRGSSSLAAKQALPRGPGILLDFYIWPSETYGLQEEVLLLQRSRLSHEVQESSWTLYLALRNVRPSRGSSSLAEKQALAERSRTLPGLYDWPSETYGLQEEVLLLQRSRPSQRGPGILLDFCIWPSETYGLTAP